MGFSDHFSGHAGIYKAARPDYPPALFEYLASQCTETRLAWDCAAGNGQAARGLQDYFDSVLLSDGSEQQIKQFRAESDQAANLMPAVMLAESVGLRAESVDIVVVAQALHWFKLDRFFQELDRVLKPGAIFAVWSYGIHHIDAAIDAVVHHLYADVLGDYWPAERRLVENHYAGIEFPFAELECPDFKLEKQWSIEQVLAYLDSWSAVQRFRTARGIDPMDEIRGDLQTAWGPAKEKTIRWPLSLIVRKKA